MQNVTLYTDGAARGNPDGPGGYGAVLQFVDSQGNLHEREFSAGYIRTTNNRMELMAVIAGLEALTKPCRVEIVSDSKYVTDAFNKKWIDGWLKKNWKGASGPVKNVDLWKRLLAAAQPHELHFTWVKRTCRAPGKRAVRSSGDDGCGHECGSDRSRGTWLTQTAFQCYNRT